MSEVVASAAAAVADIASGSRVAVGGFGVCGIPDALIAALAASAVTDLEIISNNCGTDRIGLGILLRNKQIRRVIASYVGENAEFARQYLAGEIEVELTPQGTLAEKLRAGGAGLPAFFTPAGIGTPVADGGLPWRYAPDGSVAISSPPKEVRTFGGRWGERRYVLEEAITTDYALVHALVGDTDGNLVFDKAARNFNPDAAMAGRVCIAQVEHLVPAGAIDPAGVHLPGIFVDRIVHTGVQTKHIEKRTVAKEK
ncbi:putative succinyl-CoA:3-ketoacid coenzyme A transferase subunit A [Nocardia neocaledoniensis NBRC 108232]|uniref:3-oxoacid CoA-transferase subunit A n=1 Tax=Nocardia neocaledoniensis TaxID=236511 RepID=A0A317P2U2_9NOCA|nr:CoA transferase subunit A [Nocardia neocaledoniensis]PWV81533.1 3-oxoacid CoA-transferase subunit A [Nocardia neocaledoniensis]GEM32143.1 putative succinyl-CoA:3-ketoacid coenzyme A transferase subunit A [Nocardia neocaledoniensis NBRC 108232]